MARTVFPGPPTKEMQHMTNALAQYNTFKDSRMGYSVGLNFPADWDEHTISIRLNDKTVVEKNMVFHIMPEMWNDDYGFELSETIVVTENGCQALANVPRILFINE